IISGLRASSGMVLSVLYRGCGGAIRRRRQGLVGIAEEAPWPWYGALTAPALEPTNGGERRAKQIPLRATGPLRKPHVLRFRNSGGAGAPTLWNMAIWVMARERTHEYRITSRWTGNLGSGTFAYTAYSQAHECT